MMELVAGELRGRFERNVAWRVPGNRSPHDLHFRKLPVIEIYDHPTLGERVVDRYAMQALCMAPSDSLVEVWVEDNRRVWMEARKSRFIQKGKSLRVSVERFPDGVVLDFESIMFTDDAPTGLGATAFFRAAQAARRLGVDRVELLAAGGATYKVDGQWMEQYNGYYSWPRFGFDAPLTEETKKLLAGSPEREGCASLLDLMACDAQWWSDNGGGCRMTFDLSRGSRSWQTLNAYLVDGNNLS